MSATVDQFIRTMLRPVQRPKGREIGAHLRRRVRAIRAHWPRTEILVRADSHDAGPEGLDGCEAAGIDDVLGLASTAMRHRHVVTLEARPRARFEAAPGTDKVRRFQEVYDGAATWRRIVARIEAGPQGPDTRVIVTTLRHGHGRALDEDVYCRRGQAETRRVQRSENHITAWKAYLAADRTSCTRATAHPFRLVLHAGASWLLWSRRALMPKRSRWRGAPFDTLRLRLVKISVRVVERKSRITIPLPTNPPIRPSSLSSLAACRA